MGIWRILRGRRRRLRRGGEARNGGGRIEDGRRMRERDGKRLGGMLVWEGRGEGDGVEVLERVGGHRGGTSVSEARELDEEG